METYLVDATLQQKLIINMENTCEKSIHYTQTALLDYCNKKGMT